MKAFCTIAVDVRCVPTVTVSPSKKKYQILGDALYMTNKRNVCNECRCNKAEGDSD